MIIVGGCEYGVTTSLGGIGDIEPRHARHTDVKKGDVGMMLMDRF